MGKTQRLEDGGKKEGEAWDEKQELKSVTPERRGQNRPSWSAGVHSQIHV